jgi:hypothetical protein
VRDECDAAGVPYVDVGELGFDAAMLEARRLLLGDDRVSCSSS